MVFADFSLLYIGFSNMNYELISLAKCSIPAKIHTGGKSLLPTGAENPMKPKTSPSKPSKPAAKTAPQNKRPAAKTPSSASSTAPAAPRK